MLPPEAVKVAESGIRDGLDVALLRDSGFDAFLVGETLLLAADPAAKLRELLIGAEI
jgi:indole-3-glycerol phosphate synthase